MKRMYLLCLILVLALLAGCALRPPGETTAPPVITPTTAPPTEPATVPTTAAPTEPAPVLRSGYYLLESYMAKGITAYGDQLASLKCYILIRDDQTGLMSMAGSVTEILWDSENMTMEGVSQPYTLSEDVLGLEGDGYRMLLRYHGDTLPAEYETQYPVGYFAVSSVGRNGNVEFYGSIDPSNGYIRIREDHTGVMVFDGVTREFTMDGSYLHTQTEQIPYFCSSVEFEEGFGEEPMFIVYLSGEEFVSIVFRPAEDPENT